MKDDKFLAAYSEPRNGANMFYRHWAAGKFHYSDGVKECADAGCYWLLDIVATEVVPMVCAHGGLMTLEVTSEAGMASLVLTDRDDGPPVWKRGGIHTDLPTGLYVFPVVDEGSRVAMTLLSEY